MKKILQRKQEKNILGMNNIQNPLKQYKMQIYAKQCIWLATGEIYKYVFAGTCINYI